jgi:hypothetical protein
MEQKKGIPGEEPGSPGTTRTAVPIFLDPMTIFVTIKLNITLRLHYLDGAKIMHK